MKMAHCIQTVCIVESLLDLAEDTEYNPRCPAADAHEVRAVTAITTVSVINITLYSIKAPVLCSGNRV